MTEYVVLGVQAYSIPDEKTGERVEGISIYYLDLAEGYEFDQTDPKEAVGGFLPGKLTAQLEDLKYFSTLPGIYDIEVKMKRTSKCSVAKLVGAELKTPMDLANVGDASDLIKENNKKLYQNMAARLGAELANASDGKIPKDQFASVMNKLQARIPELATSK